MTEANPIQHFAEGSLVIREDDLINLVSYLQEVETQNDSILGLMRMILVGKAGRRSIANWIVENRPDLVDSVVMDLTIGHTRRRLRKSP